MKVLVLTLNQWNTFHTWLKGKGLSWFKELPDGTVDPRSTSKTTATSPNIGISTANKYVINLDKLDRTALKNTQVWKNHKEQIKSRICLLDMIEINRE